MALIFAWLTAWENIATSTYCTNSKSDGLSCDLIFSISKDSFGLVAIESFFCHLIIQRKFPYYRFVSTNRYSNEISYLPGDSQICSNTFLSTRVFLPSKCTYPWWTMQQWIKKPNLWSTTISPTANHLFLSNFHESNPQRALVTIDDEWSFVIQSTDW